jgi:hypothetical protein
MKDTAKKSTFTQNLGDKIERLGEKISDAGATKIGQKIYQSGNKLEHKDDKVIDKSGKKPMP